jgi:hypothetical protein
MMKFQKHIFCQCMKPWSVCANKKNSYKIDVRDLIDTRDIVTPSNLSPLHLHYDFVNKQWLQYKFNCRFLDHKKSPPLTK